jgi:hypothetical protein
MFENRVGNYLWHVQVIDNPTVCLPFVLSFPGHVLFVDPNVLVQVGFFKFVELSRFLTICYFLTMVLFLIRLLIVSFLLLIVLFLLIALFLLIMLFCC